MLHSLVVAATLLAPGDFHHALPQNPKAVPLLKTWLKQYRSGKIDVGDVQKNIGGKSGAKKAGLITKAQIDEWNGHVSQVREVAALVEGAAKVNTDKAAQVLLDAAAVGLDPNGKYIAKMAPWFVRWKVREEIKKLSNPEARDYLVAAAKGSPKGPKKLRLALQAAALGVLGTFGDRSYLAVMEGGLKHENALVRAFAAEGLATQSDVKSLPAVLTALEQEKDELARNRLFFAFFQIYGANRGAVKRGVVGRGEKAAASVFGKGSWRSDMVAIDFARRARSKEAVPGLIEVLARFVEHPEDVAAGKLTGRQRTLAYETLTDITGAYYPMDDAKNWRDYWKRSKETFEVANNRKTVDRRKAEFAESEKKRRAALGESQPADAAAEKPRPTVGMSTGKVFGTPIQGSRVLFILDVSNHTMDGVQISAEHLPAELKGKKRIKRLDVMKAVVHNAIESLTTDTCFNIVAAAGGKPRMWQKKGPVAATAANKKAAQKFIKSQGGSGGQGAWSNPYDSIEIGLGIQDLAWGRLGTHNIDEVFMLMVRLPELGKVTHSDLIRITVEGISQLSKVRFNTAYLGAENDEHDTQGTGKRMMEELAKATGGKFIRP